LACPYAKSIRGTVAYCSVVNKKVSTLRYPCKGNYKRCPLYIRYSAKIAKAREAAASEAPGGEARPEPVQKPVEPQKPQPPTAATAGAGGAVATASEPTVAGPAPPPGRVVRPSKALCDSLILASLTVAGESVGKYRGPLRELAERLRGEVREGRFIFVTGDVDGYKFRALFAGNVVTYSFARGSPICGEEAERLYEELKDREIDAMIYLVRWDRIPLWRDQIKAEISG